MGTEEEKAATLKALSVGSGYIRSELGKRIRLRKIPELLFKFDASIDYGSHIDNLLHKLNRKEIQTYEQWNEPCHRIQRAAGSSS